MIDTLSCGMVYAGSALMAFNVFSYVRFARGISRQGDWQREKRILRLPILLLALFLCGYLAVGLWGTPDPVVAGILFGGSVFVAVMLVLLRRAVERIRRQEHMAAALEAAEKASAAKTFFLSNMSHDLRTPLNAVIGYTALARREDATLAQARDYLSKIDAAGRHLLEIIDDVLEMSRIESGRLNLENTPTNLTEVVKNAADLMRHQMEEKGIRFEQDIRIRRPWVLCDGAHLSRALMNLLGNACKFTGEGGEVSLSAVEGEATEGAVACTFRVKDNGIGMSPAFAQKVFTPFERERTSSVSRIEGTGLGMAITKGFVDAMGGSIRVNTRQGAGTEFIMDLSFPPAQTHPEPSDVPPAPPSRRFSGARLLLVEDNPINQEIARLLLEHEGFLLDTASDGREAVDKVRDMPPGTYAAVLMDIQMPVMDGYAATRAIRALDDPGRAGVPIVAMTANAFEEDRQAALEAGMQGHISKPIDPGKMMATLEEVLNEQGEDA
ncbi:MAG: response regulator [Clostridia bacterium]|nr:response regulator [Clostridia bacterium]